MSVRRCAACESDGYGVGGLTAIGGCLLCAICVEMYRVSAHAPEQGGRGVPAYVAAIRMKKEREGMGDVAGDREGEIGGVLDNTKVQ